MDPRKAQVIELRFFGGLSVEETAEVLKISAQSVLRDWKLAKAWLTRELRAGCGEAGVVVTLSHMRERPRCRLGLLAAQSPPLQVPPRSFRLNCRPLPGPKEGIVPGKVRFPSIGRIGGGEYSTRRVSSAKADIRGVNRIDALDRATPSFPQAHSRPASTESKTSDTPAQ